VVPHIQAAEKHHGDTEDTEWVHGSLCMRSYTWPFCGNVTSTVADQSGVSWCEKTVTI